jgi:outer membrane protein OmpU
MNIKKIGLTALAGSLVATSAFAGAMSVAGSASMKVQHVNGGAADTGKAFSMGNQLTFTGSGEVNGLDVSLSFVLDQGDDTKTTANSATSVSGTTSPFDSHSVKISSDELGALTFHGEGGSSAQSAIDTTAAGDLWDSSFGITAAQDPKASATSDNMLSYTLPTMIDDVAITASYTPKAAAATYESSTAFAVSYTGVEGLSLDYGIGENNGTNGSTADVTTIKGEYTYASITVGFSETEYDSESSAADEDQEVTSYEIAYTVNDDISISYGVEEIAEPNDTDDQDIEVAGIVATYTTGGLTVTAKGATADNVDMTSTHTADREHWSLVAAFAF